MSIVLEMTPHRVHVPGIHPAPVPGVFWSLSVNGKHVQGGLTADPAVPLAAARSYLAAATSDFQEAEDS